MVVKEHPKFKGYFVTPNGIVYYIHGYKYKKTKKPLAVNINKDGYKRVKVNNIYRTVHLMVAETYLNKPDEDNIQVNHKDLDKMNNNYLNLEWITQKENLHHVMRNGVHNFGITPILALPMDGVIGFWYPSQTAVQYDGFTQANVNKVLKGERKHHKNFKWEYY